MTSSHPVDYSRFCHREAVSLEKAGYEVSLIGLRSDSSVRVPPGLTLIPVEERHGLAKRKTISCIRQLALAQDAAVYHCFDPWTLDVALSISRCRPQVKVVYDSTELYPEYYAERGDLPLLMRCILAGRVRRLEAEAARRADAIIETNSTRARRFTARNREPVLVPNYPSVDAVPRPKPERQPLIAYTGLVSKHRGFDKLLAAFAQVAQEFPQARIRVAGSFDPRSDIRRWTESFIKDQRLAERVEFLGWLPYQQMLQAVSGCLAGVILLQPGRTNDFTGQPNKLFEFMVSGLAVVASRFPEIAPVVEETCCGWLVDPADVTSIAGVLRQVLSNAQESVRRGDEGRRAVLERYNWTQAEKNLLSLYEKLCR